MPDIDLLVEGGKANAGPPLGPSLAPLGVNIGQIVSKINEKTKEFNGMKVPVKVKVDVKTKAFEIEVGSPPTSALIKKELKIEKGSGTPKTGIVGNLSLDQVKKIAEGKLENLSSTDLQKAMHEVIGTANSMGVTIEGKRGKIWMAESRGEKIEEDFEEVVEKPKPKETAVEKTEEKVKETGKEKPSKESSKEKSGKEKKK